MIHSDWKRCQVSIFVRSEGGKCGVVSQCEQQFPPDLRSMHYADPKDCSTLRHISFHEFICQLTTDKCSGFMSINYKRLLKAPT